MDMNEERLAFYHELGMAITSWAHVEFALSWIVSDCFSEENGHVPIAGFMSIDNFRAKLQYADTVVSAQKLSKIERGNWTKLVERAGTISRMRNRLAHYWVLNSTQ